MNRITKMLGILIAGIAAGLVGLFIVYLLPVEEMQTNMKASLTEFMAEGENPFLVEGLKGSSLDNYTDAIMLGSAVYKTDMPFWQSAVRVPRAADVEGMPMESLDDYLTSKESSQESEYARYWHGYLLYLKPLLLFLNYIQIRMVNGCIQLILAIWILYKFISQGMKRGAVAYVLAVLSMFPMVFPYSLQFSSVFYIGNIALLIVLKKYKKWKNEEIYLYFFQIIGMCTSFFDFLTFPLFTFGMPMALCMVLFQNQKLKEKAFFFIKNGLAWGLGYILMWMGKWFAGSLITGENLWTNALGTVATRVSSEAYGENTGRLWAILRNGYIYFNRAGIVLAVLLFLWLGFSFWKHRKKIAWLKIIPLIVVACIPLLWYLVASNHSYVHYWYTFRVLAVSVFALTLIPQCIGEGD